MLWAWWSTTGVVVYYRRGLYDMHQMFSSVPPMAIHDRVFADVLEKTRSAPDCI